MTDSSRPRRRPQNLLREALREHQESRSPEARPAESAADGERSFSRYELLETLGRGGMGVVWRARDRRLDRVVALKLLREDLSFEPEALLRFEREAHALARLSHPNIVRVHDQGTDGGRVYLVLELIEGSTLASLLQSRELDRREILGALAKVARAVHHAHERGIVHRDLTPANVLFDRQGEPKVTDFGLALMIERAGDLTREHVPMGTLMYMAPEQAHPGTAAIGPCTDVHALGAILYQVLTGRPPFTGETSIEVLRRIERDDPVAPRRLDPSIHPELEAIALRALEKEPKRRYASAALFAEEIECHLTDRPVLARSPTAWTRFAKGCRRHPLVSSMAAMAALTAVTVGAHEAWKRATGERERAGEGVLAAELALAGEAALARDLDATAERIAAARERFAPDAELEALEREAARLRGQLLGASLHLDELDPGDSRRERRIAQVALAELRAAEERGEDDAAARMRELLLGRGAGGAAAAELAAPATLLLGSDPPGARVRIARYEAGADGRLVAAAPRELGATPLGPLSLEPASWRCEVALEGRPTVVVPIDARRGEVADAHVRLLEDAAIGDGFAWVPGGECRLGETPRRGRRTRVDGFLLARREVTWGEYLEFARDDATVPAREWIARIAEEARPALQWDGEQPRLADAADASRPARGIAWHDAVAYCRFRTRQSAADGLAVETRLPTAREWERAARGADGRAYPWGDRFDARYLAAAPADESPFGILDLAGGVREWCSDLADAASGARSLRGGCFADVDPAEFLPARARAADPAALDPRVGFRVARSLPNE